MTDIKASSSQQQIGLEQIFAPVIEPLANPMFMGYFGLMVLLAILSLFSQGNKPKVHKGRFATLAEINKARKKGLRQIARQKPSEPALELDTLVLPSLAPAVAVIGGSGSGKTRTFFDPGIKSAIDQGWTNLVFDVKGNLMRKHAAYAHSKGYDVYVYAPGFPYSDGINFLDFMEDETDAKTAYELATVINENLKGKSTTKGDDFFTPQGIGLLKMVFMLAKSTCFPDIFTAWKFLSLDKLAERLQGAQEYGLFGGKGDGLVSSLNSWINEAALPLRSVSEAPETSVGIIGSATTHFQKIVDRSLMPCLLKSSIPLDLTGKQIVFFQLDEQAESVTAPLVAAAINMFVYRNLNGMTKRENTLGLWLDEVGSILLPKLEMWINRFREYGMMCAIGYQSNPQLEMKYDKSYLQSVLASCKTKLVFRTGDPETAEKFSAAFGYTDKIFKTESRSYGKNKQRSLNQQLQKVRLVPASELNDEMEDGKCVISTTEFKGHPYKKRVRILKRNDRLWEKCTHLWDKDFCPVLTEQTEQRFSHTSMEVEKSDREVITAGKLPSVNQLKAWKRVKELRARTESVG